MSISKSRLHGILAHVCVLALLAIPIFGHLDSLPFEMFDEQRQAVNAMEMSVSGRFFATTFDHAPELWNTKPPLFIWAQVLFMRLFGYNELSARLPAAIAAALCCLLLLRFLKRRTDSWMAGIIAAGILLTSPGFIGSHASRTADYDTLLALCTTAALVWLADFIEEGKSKWLYLSGIALIAAVFTKGVAGLFLCPAMLAYVLIRKKGLPILRNRAFWICLLSFLVIIPGYYLLRDSQQPGYLDAVVRNELGGRFNEVVEQHKGDFWTYYDHLRDEGFKPWFWLIIPALAAAALVKDEAQRRIAVLSSLAILSLYLVIASAATKLPWYLVPIYPLLSMLCGLLIWQVCQLLLTCKFANAIWKINILPLLLLFFIGLNPYIFVLDQALNASKDGADWDARYYLKELLEGHRTTQASYVCANDYPVTWYLEVAQLNGKPIRKVSKDSLFAGMKVMVWNEDVLNHISTHYATDTVEQYRAVKILEVKGPLQAVDSLGSGEAPHRVQ